MSMKTVDDSFYLDLTDQDGMIKLPLWMAELFIGLLADGCDFANALDDRVYGEIVAVSQQCCFIKQIHSAPIMCRWDQTRLEVDQVMKLTARIRQKGPPTLKELFPGGDKDGRGAEVTNVGGVQSADIAE